MNQLKQNIMVVSILFLSLLTSVALSYAITPTEPSEEKIEQIIVEPKEEPFKMNISLSILIPNLVK